MHGRGGHLHVGRTPRAGQGDAVGQPAARRLCLRTSPARHLLHQDRDGPFDPADSLHGRHRASVRQHLPASPVTDRRWLRSRPPALLPLPLVDLRPGRQPGRRARQGGISRNSFRPGETDRATRCRMCRLPVDFAGPQRDPRSRRSSGRSSTNWTPGASADGRRWARRCWTARSTGNSPSTRSPRTTISRRCTRIPSRPSRVVTARCSIRSARTTDLSFPQRNSGPRECSGGAVGAAAEHGGHLRAVPEHRVVGDDRQRGAVPRLSRRRAWPFDHRAPELNTAGSVRRVVVAGAAAVFDYAHATVRDEDYALVAGLQTNLESGARENLVFGRNEPGLQHRHQTWSASI